jgi:collagenase-like PrtC family protease
VGGAAGEVTLGPVLFNWPAERWRDFYFRIADEAPVSTVCLGETICSKRDPLIGDHYEPVAERLARAGKTVVHATLAQVVLDHDRALVEQVSSRADVVIEANDGSALTHLRGRPHHIGPFMNVYNERTVAFLAANGARNFCLPPELPAGAIEALCAATRDLAVTLEVLVFGRVPLALSARCYHARAHGRTRSNCRFVCDRDPDGMVLTTLDGRPFLAVNGIQTLSWDYLNLAAELAGLAEMGVARFRLSPHDCDMVEVASVFRAVLDGRVDGGEATTRLDALNLGAPFSNGFFHARPGHTWAGTVVR